MLNKISKEYITTGAFWIEYKGALDKIKVQHQTVDEALVITLKTLRKHLDDIYLSLFPDEKQRGKIVQALIDRTLFIKFLEDKKIINSGFYQVNFGDADIHFKDLLEQKDAQKINKLFFEINKTFNNKLFETPEIKDSDLLDNALIEIANAIKRTSPDGQLSLFDFQFDIIPVEFISHIYQIFLDDEKKEKGIFYTPESLATLIVENVIEKKQAGTVLDPSCGSGIFLILAFRQMYNLPAKSNIYDEIQQRLQFIKNHIFGIELENTAVRLAVFSLYLEVLKDIPAEELNNLVTKLIRDNVSKTLFSVDFSDNIKEQNALIEGEQCAFDGQTFDYIIGNPPWFVINKNAQTDNETINYAYWNKYRNFFSRERQISQCFLHKINFWSGTHTKFGFIVNSSNFINESDNFQKFIFSTYRLERIFELYHIKNILFDYAKEPACLLIFDNQSLNNNHIEYYLPQLNSFAETFRTILLNKNDVIILAQSDLLCRKIKLRDFLIGNKNELELANKLESENTSIKNITISNSTNSYRGFEDWGTDALKKEFSEVKNNISEETYNLRRRIFLNKYYSNIKDKEHNIPFIKSSQLDKFRIKNITTYCKEDISTFHRPRNLIIYNGEKIQKILCSRIGGEIVAVYSNDKIYFGSDIYVFKLQNPKLYHTITCCLNSKLLNFFSQVKLRKRIDSVLSRLDSSDLERMLVPAKINQTIVEQLNTISKGISNGIYSFAEKENEINELVCDLYDLTYIERQRISDFFIPNTQKVTKKDMENYCNIFDKTIHRYLKTGIVSMEYSCPSNLPFDIASVKITLGNNEKPPAIKEVNKFINYQLLKQVGDSPVIALKQCIYTEDCIYIIKDTNAKNWTISAAFDDARVEIDKLFKNE